MTFYILFEQTVTCDTEYIVRICPSGLCQYLSKDFSVPPSLVILLDRIPALGMKNMHIIKISELSYLRAIHTSV